MRYSRPATAIAFLLLASAFVVLLTPRIVQVQKLKARSADLEGQLIRLRQQNDMLENELKMLRDDPVYLERVARQKFNKAKEGEIVYKVVREGGSSAS